MHYLGTQADPGGALVSDAVPASIFHSTAVFSSSASPASGTDATETLKFHSFWSVHMEVQRRQPTFRGLRWAARLKEEELGRAPTVDDLCTMFPASSKHLVPGLWTALCETLSKIVPLRMLVRRSVAHGRGASCQMK